MSWIGSIYQKFEAACQEVDDVVSQETIKYVENHVQTVGESVKVFCSNVVQEAKAASVKKNDEIGSYIKSIIGMENILIDRYTRQSLTKEIATYPVNTPQLHPASGLHLANQFNTSFSLDSLESRESSFLEKDGHYLANEKEDESLEKNAMKEESVPEVLELISPNKLESSEASLCSKLIDDNCETVCASVAEMPATSVPDQQFEFRKKEESVFIPISDDKGVPDVLEFTPSGERGLSEAHPCSDMIDDNNETVCALIAEIPPLTSVPDLHLKFCQKEGPADTLSSDDSRVPEVSELISPGKIESFEASFCNLIGDYREIVGAMMDEVLPSNSVPDVHLGFCQIGGTSSSTCSDDKECASDASGSLRYVERTLSAVFLEEQSGEMNTGSLVTNSHHLLEGSSENVLTDVQLLDKPADMAGRVSDSSNALSTCPSDSVLLASSSSVKSLESHEKDASTTMGTTYLNGSSGNWHPQFHCSCQFEAVVSSSYIGLSDDCISDIVDQEMETIELFDDNVKVEEGSVGIDTCDLYAVIRAQKVRSYKRRFQDLFARKKRLVKEYEQLAILHGDVDFGSLDKTSHTHLASTSTSQFDSKNSQTEQPSDGEWEIL